MIKARLKVNLLHCGVSDQTNTNVLFAVQVGVLAPHDHVWDLHYNHEVSLLKPNLLIGPRASTPVWILTEDKPCLVAGSTPSFWRL